MSPSPNSSHVDLTSEQADSLLAPPSTLQTHSVSIDGTHSHLKGYYTQLSTSEKEQVRIEGSLRTTRFSLSPWLLEILSFSLALAAIAVLIALLALYDKKQNPPWAADISLNTLVSIASVLFRASVMVPITKCISQLSWIWLAKTERPLEDVALFDQASRGVLGGLAILASPRHVTSAVPIGAILMIIMVAVGPCFQQTVAYYSAQVVDDTSSAYTSAAFGYNGSAGSHGSSYASQGTYLGQTPLVTALT
ncbi:hypothetical protein ACET3X_005561 [Alternaria dauci]|uniref:Uncharacterized protein n=1 Tax=Alternaria dauci TaxID=48095 RepID=A0ABR3UKL8_9PLEO